MTPIRNVSDRERKLQAEIDALKEKAEYWQAYAESGNESFAVMMADRESLKAELAKLKAQEPAAWINGFGGGPANKGIYGWSDHPIGTKFYLAAGAQGHTREQIGLMQDDRREGLGAHHVYCRVVTEDV